MGVVIKKWYIHFIYRIVQSADKSAISERSFSLSLLKLGLLLPLVCGLRNRQKHFAPPPPLVFLFPFLLVCIMLDFFHTKQNASIFLSSGVEPVTSCHGAQDTELWSRGRTLRRTNGMPVNMGSALDSTRSYKGGMLYTPQNSGLEPSWFSVSNMWAKGVFSKNFKLNFIFKWLTNFVSKFYI